MRAGSGWRAALAVADLRARLHAPVTTRAELIASLVGPADTPLVASWMIDDASQVAADDEGILLSVPIVVPEGALSATVTTPDPAGAITITTGIFSVRFTDAEGLGLLILVWAAAVLAAWWLQTLHRRSHDAASASGTVAAPGSSRGNAAD